MVPGEALASTPRYRVATVGTPPPPRWLTTYAVDLVALADGSWRVVRDLTDAPMGIGYALLDRSVMGRVADELLGRPGPVDLASLSGFPAELRHALGRRTPVASPRIVLFTAASTTRRTSSTRRSPACSGSTWSRGPTSSCAQGRLWLRTLGGLDPIDVVYRRGRTSPRSDRAQRARRRRVPGLPSAAAEGGVVLANAHGAG